MSLPFNPAVKEQAKELRQAGMPHEAWLWNQLKRVLPARAREII
jgi:hypothetical protein